MFGLAALDITVGTRPWLVRYNRCYALFGPSLRGQGCFSVHEVHGLSESEKLLQNLQEGDSRAIIAKCAPQVDYYDKGKISTCVVRLEIDKYFNRWGDRHYSKVETTLLGSDFDAGIYHVQLDFDWSVSDLKNNSRSGRSRVELVWKGTTNDNLSIVTWKEHRLQQ